MTQSNPHEDLAYIKQIMLDSRRIICTDGINFIFWGIVVVVGQLLTYLKHYLNWEISTWWLWPVLIGSGWVFTIIIEWNREKRSRTSTFAGKILASVRFSCGITMTIIGFVGSIVDAYNGAYINPLLCSVLAIAYFISGTVYGKKWISFISVGWWLGAVIMFVWPYLYTLLLMAALMILLQTIPGYVLYKESKKELKEAI